MLLVRETVFALSVCVAFGCFVSVAVCLFWLLRFRLRFACLFVLCVVLCF